MEDDELGADCLPGAVTVAQGFEEETVPEDPAGVFLMPP